ncbi:MAG: hypothetical protein ACJ736_07745 [Streptomyces sp.]
MTVRRLRAVRHRVGLGGAWRASSWTPPRTRPAGEDDWSVLRHDLGAVIGRYDEDPVGALATTRLVPDTPPPYLRHLEKQHG